MVLDSAREWERVAALDRWVSDSAFGADTVTVVICEHINSPV